MKRIFLLLIAGIFLAGCSDIANTPIDQAKSTYKQIKMPAPKNAAKVELSNTVAEKIIGNFGGSLGLTSGYESLTGNVTTDAALTIVRGAYNGAKVISITQEAEYVSVDLNPSMKFYSPVELNFTATGLQFTAADTADIYFAYIPDDGGAPERVTEYKSIRKDPASGTLEVVGAKLHHFSRYSWVK